MAADQRALFRRAVASIANDAVGIEIVSDPGERMRRQRLQIVRLLLHPFRLGDEILGLVHAHQFRAEMQHQRSLDVAAMDAVALLMLADHAVRRAETRPLRGNDGHLVAYA